MKVAEADLVKTLTVFKAEGVRLTTDICKLLLERKITKFIEQGQYLEVFNTLNLFGASSPKPFDPLNPLLADLSSDMTTKIESFSTIVLEKMLIDWIRAGSDKAPQVLQFSKHVLNIYAEVEPMYIDDATAAREFDDQYCLFKALVSTLDVDAETPYSDCISKTNH
eukprot:6492596-Amphidinium_carterae.2